MDAPFLAGLVRPDEWGRYAAALAGIALAVRLERARREL
jgi:hypothetical protein